MEQMDPVLRLYYQYATIPHELLLHVLHTFPQDDPLKESTGGEGGRNLNKGKLERTVATAQYTYLDIVSYSILYPCILNISHDIFTLIASAMFIKKHACVELYVNS